MYPPTMRGEFSMPIDIVIFFIIQGIICGAFTAKVAKAKGYEKDAWMAGGFLFSIIALIAIAGMPMNNNRTSTA